HFVDQRLGLAQAAFLVVALRSGLLGRLELELLVFGEETAEKTSLVLDREVTLLEGFGGFPDGAHDGGVLGYEIAGLGEGLALGRLHVRAGTRWLDLMDRAEQA